MAFASALEDNQIDVLANMQFGTNCYMLIWDNNVLIGIARSISDFSYVTYISDLAVRKSYQKKGIGKKLIKITRKESGIKSTMVLLSAPLAEKYYPRIGFASHKSAWILKPGEKLD